MNSCSDISNFSQTPQGAFLTSALPESVTLFSESKKPDMHGPWCTFLIVQPQYLRSSFRISNPNPCETQIHYPEFSRVNFLSALWGWQKWLWTSQCLGHLTSLLILIWSTSHVSLPFCVVSIWVIWILFEKNVWDGSKWHLFHKCYVSLTASLPAGKGASIVWLAGVKGQTFLVTLVELSSPPTWSVLSQHQCHVT